MKESRSKWREAEEKAGNIPRRLGFNLNQKRVIDEAVVPRGMTEETEGLPPPQKIAKRVPDETAVLKQKRKQKVLLALVRAAARLKKERDEKILQEKKEKQRRIFLALAALAKKKTKQKKEEEEEQKKKEDELKKKEEAEQEIERKKKERRKKIILALALLAKKRREVQMQQKKDDVLHADTNDNRARTDLAKRLKRRRILVEMTNIARQRQADEKKRALEVLRRVFYNPRTGYIRNARDLIQRLDTETRRVLTEKEVRQFILDQETVQINTQARDSNKVHISADRPGAELQMDLVDVSSFAAFHNAGYDWILTMIDLYSRYAWARPLRKKTKEETAEAVKSVLKEITDSGKFIFAVQSDNGKEFLNSEVGNIIDSTNDRAAGRDVGDPSHVTNAAGDHRSQGAIERFNQTLRRRLQLVFTATKNKRWRKILEDILFNYNSSTHSTVGAPPALVWEGIVLAGGPVSKTVANTNVKKNKKESAHTVHPRGYEKIPRPGPEVITGRVLVPIPNEFTKRAHHETWSRELYTVVPAADGDAPNSHWYKVRRVDGTGAAQMIRRKHFLIINSPTPGTRPVDEVQEQEDAEVTKEDERAARIARKLLMLQRQLN